MDKQQTFPGERMMFEHLLYKKKKKIIITNDQAQQAKIRKIKIEILVLYLPCTIEIASEACELVVSFTFLIFFFFSNDFLEALL